MAPPKRSPYCERARLAARPNNYWEERLLALLDEPIGPKEVVRLARRVRALEWMIDFMDRAAALALLARLDESSDPLARFFDCELHRVTRANLRDRLRKRAAQKPPPPRRSALGPVRKRDTNGTGWAFTGVRDAKVGFHLEDVTHDDFAFADSIRVERIAVAGFTDNDGYRVRDDIANHHVFGLGDCTEIEAPTLADLGPGTKDPLGYYAPRLKAYAKYELPHLVFEKDQKFEAELAYLFTAYGKDPSHEPGGIVTAARCYPTFTFTIPDVTHKAQKRRYRSATAVQVLFRINLRLDDRGVGNQCGVFADLEDLGPLGAIESSVTSGGKPGSFTFLKAEKPVVFDIAGRGIDHGATAGWGGTIQGWDNIHQYSHPAMPGGRREDGFDRQPFTPGLPYGAHMHWRWGATAATGAPALPGGKQFGGPQGPGTPLIDDRIRDQTLDFAIVDLNGWFGRQEGTFLTKVDQDPVSFLFRDFSDVWQDVHPLPDSPLPSGNMVIWLSITAWGPGWNLTSPGYRESFPGSGVSPKDFPKVEHTVRYVLPSWGGTIFPQGMFFTHMPEYFPGRIKLRLIPGVDKAQYLPRQPKRTWRR